MEYFASLAASSADRGAKAFSDLAREIDREAQRNSFQIDAKVLNRLMAAFPFSKSTDLAVVLGDHAQRSAFVGQAITDALDRLEGGANV